MERQRSSTNLDINLATVIILSTKGSLRLVPVKKIHLFSPILQMIYKREDAQHNIINTR